MGCRESKLATIRYAQGTFSCDKNHRNARSVYIASQKAWFTAFIEHDWLLELWSGHPQGFSLYPHVLCNLATSFGDKHRLQASVSLLRSVIKLCKLGRLSNIRFKRK